MGSIRSKAKYAASSDQRQQQKVFVMATQW